MKKITTLLVTGLVSLTFAGCGGGEEEQGASPKNEGAPQEGQVSVGEVVVGGFAVEGPDGGVTLVPEVTTEREDVENYLQSVRPVIQDTARDFSQVIDPSANLQNQTLTLSVEVESIQQADTAVEEGLEALRQVQPPESLEPIHELLVAAYEQALPAYDNILESFGSGDVNNLTEAAREGLPEIGQFTTETRAILQELERAETVNPDEQAESRG